jgi:hypothetical protein
MSHHNALSGTSALSFPPQHPLWNISIKFPTTTHPWNISIIFISEIRSKYKNQGKIKIGTSVTGHNDS